MAKLNGAEYLARTFDAYGVKAVFLVPTILSRTLYEIEQQTDIARIVSHGEKASVYMADGYARASGQPGVCMSQNVGAANLAAGLRDPYLGCSPVVALTGGHFTISQGRNYYQEIENLPLFVPVTKFSTQVPDTSRLPDLIEHAFYASVAGKPGPTHLELPGHAGDGIESELVDVAAPEPRTFTMPAERSTASREAVEAAVRALLSASRPVIVAGGGARISGAGPELLALAERLDVPVATSLNAKDLIPGNHRLNIGVPGSYPRASANQILLEADLVFYVGSQTGSQVTLSWQVPPAGTRVVQLDIEATELGRHYQAATALLCDAKLGLAQLLEALIGTTAADHSEWIARAENLSRRWREDVEANLTSDAEPIRPERICAELTASLPADAVLVSDTGHSGMWTGGYVDLNSGAQSYLRAAGSLGWGLPAALGAQIAVPDRQVFLFSGDGGLFYHLAELETAARWNIPVVIVVNDNHSLNQEIGPYSAAYGGTLHGRHGELWHFSELDLAKVAESLGVTGLRVTRPADLAGAFERALESSGPVLIDVVSDIEVVAQPGSALRAS